MERRGFTCLELMAVICVIWILGVILLSSFPHRSQEAARRASCANNLKQIGLSLKMYSHESVDGAYPRTGYYYESLVDCDSEDFTTSGGRVGVYTNSLYMPDVYPEYMPDPRVLICPSDVEVGWESEDDFELGDLEFSQLCKQDGRGATEAGFSYTYLNYYFDKVDGDSITASSSEIGLLGELYGANEAMENMPIQLGLYASILFDLKDRDPGKLLEVLDGDIDLVEVSKPFDISDVSTGVPVGNRDTNTLYRIREGVVRFFTDDGTDSDTMKARQSDIPIMFDNVATDPAAFNHIPGGSNVLYMDGHVSFVKFGPEGTFPVNRPMGALMEAMRGHPTFMKK